MSKNQLSKFLSGLLRHFPDEYSLEYDSEGWFELNDVVECVQNKNNYRNIKESDIIQIVQDDKKGRYEIDEKGEKIRAVYGHSIEINPVESENEIPDKLYHGTPERNKDSILKNGLISKNRQSVHLTDSKNQAQNVGSRHTRDGNIIVFRVNVSRMKEDDFKVRSPTDNSVYTVSEVPPKYLDIV